jgi:hypothetical protein
MFALHVVYAVAYTNRIFRVEKIQSNMIPHFMNDNEVLNYFREYEQ